MDPLKLIAIIEAGLKLGQTAVEIARRICDDAAGYPLPSIEDFDEKTRELEQRPDL